MATSLHSRSKKSSFFRAHQKTSLAHILPKTLRPPSIPKGSGPPNSYALDFPLCLCAAIIMLRQVSLAINTVWRSMREAPYITWIAIGLVALISPFLGFWVHVCLVKYYYLWHARRVCRKKHLEIREWTAGYCFEECRGRWLKTALTGYELDCQDSQGRRLVVNLLVGVVGVKAAFGLPGYPAEPYAVPKGRSRLSVQWERGSGPQSVS